MEKKFLNKTFPFVLALIASMTLIVSAMFGAACLLAFSKTFYDIENSRYDLLDEIGIDQADFDVVVNALIDFMTGKSDKLEAPANVDGIDYANFYSDRSIKHMVDVKVLFDITKYFAIIGAPAALLFLMFAALLTRKKSKKPFAFGILAGIILLFLILGGLGTWIIADFSGAFTKFHELLFTNDLWLLDPSEDFMIRMLPSGVFFDASIIIVACGAITILALLALMIVLLVRHKKQSIKPSSYISEI